MPYVGDRLAVRNPNPYVPTIEVHHKPDPLGSSDADAVFIHNWATGGQGRTVAVFSDNEDATAVHVQGAGSLVKLFNADGDLKFEIDNEGAVTLTGVMGLTGAMTLTGDLTIQGAGKAYRFRRGGGALDLEGTGSDLLISNWSGGAFNGTQRSYFRLSADAQNVQVAGKVEFVDALYGATRHVIDGAANTLGFHGAAPVAQQTVTGATGGNAALIDLLAKLETLGVIVDGTT